MMHKRGTVIGCLFLVTTALLSCVSGFGLGGIPLLPVSPPIQTANATGTYKVGVRQETYLFQGRILTNYWWYPANHPAGSTPYVSAGGIKGAAVLNAPLDNSGGPYPLVMFTPGLGAYPDAYYFYTQNLASSGYIVVSTEHFDTKLPLPTLDPELKALATSYQMNNDGSRAVWITYTDWFRTTQFAQIYRAQEIVFGLDDVLQAAKTISSAFYGAIDKDKIGMVGHSLGGYYTLLVGGGMPIYCDYPMTPDELNVNNPILTEDPRIKAIITLAPPIFIKESQIARSAAKITKPLMILTGDDLMLESTRTTQRLVFDNSAGSSYWVMVSNTSHYLVGDAYQLNPTFSGQIPAQGKANFVDKAAVYMKYSSAFFDVYLKNKSAAKATLHSYISPFVADLAYRD